MNETFKQYQVEPDASWQDTWRYGGGYDVIEALEMKGWQPISGWARDGYDLGNWPLVIVFHKNRPDAYSVVEYVEGDVTMYTCPTKELREQITDEIAFWHWHFNSEDWTKGYESVEELPQELRGPYRAA